MAEYSNDKNALQKLEELSRIQYMFQDDADEQVLLSRLRSLEKSLVGRGEQMSTQIDKLKSKTAAVGLDIDKKKREKREKQVRLYPWLSIVFFFLLLCVLLIANFRFLFF